MAEGGHLSHIDYHRTLRLDDYVTTRTPGLHTLQGLVVNRLVFHSGPANYHRLVSSGLSYPASVVAAGKPPTPYSPLLPSTFSLLMMHLLHSSNCIPLLQQPSSLYYLHLLLHNQSSSALPSCLLLCHQTTYCAIYTYEMATLSTLANSLADIIITLKFKKRIDSLTN